MKQRNYGSKEARERKTTAPPNTARSERSSPRRSVIPSRPEADEKFKQWQRLNAQRRQARSLAWNKARWSAHVAAKSSPTRTKWVQVGAPVKVRTKPQLSIEENDGTAPMSDFPEHVSNEGHADELVYAIPEQAFRWNLCFARLQARCNRKHSHPPLLDIPIGLNPKAAEYAKYILEHAEAGLDIRQIEKHFGVNWLEIWLHAALSTMDTSPQEVPRFLRITHLAPHPPSAWLNDCLQFLAEHFSKSEAPFTESIYEEIVEVLCTLMNRPGPRPMLLQGSVVRLLLPHCAKDQVLRIFDNICRYQVQMHWNTLLHIASRLAQSDCFEQALDALLYAASSGADLQSLQYESTCATILRRAAKEPDGLRVSLRIIQNLSELGVKLNVQHCNIAMLNAVESGDLKSAFSIYHSLVENGLQADAYTHAILLKGCKTEIQDSETLNATIRQAIAETEVLKSPVLAMEILHNLYIHHFERNPETAFGTVAEAYTQLFDASSLIRLRILPADSQNASKSRLSRPSLAAVGIMLSAYLRERIHRRSLGAVYIDRQLHHLYKHTRNLAERGVQPWVALSQTDYVANSFLVAFTANSGSLGHAAEVIRDMQTPLPAILDSPNPAARVERQVCKPSVQSWSIFLHGFAKHKKMDLAEQVLQYMRSKGMVPNQVTWNNLVSGYVGVRDHEGVVRAFRQMQEEGWSGTELTWKSMGKLGVDAGMLSQGEEVREALRRRIERENMVRIEQRRQDAERPAQSKTLDSNAATDFWDPDEADDDLSLEQRGIDRVQGPEDKEIEAVGAMSNLHV